jgi:hypothetical protein
VILAERMAHPGGRHEEAPQVGMACEGDAEHVPGLALIPICRRPDIDHTRQRRVLTVKRHLDAHIGIAFIGEELIDNGEIACRLILAAGPQSFVDATKIVEHAIRWRRLLFQVPQDATDMLLRHPQRRNPITGGLWRDSHRTKPLW